MMNMRTRARNGPTVVIQSLCNITSFPRPLFEVPVQGSNTQQLCLVDQKSSDLQLFDHSAIPFKLETSCCELGTFHSMITLPSAKLMPNLPTFNLTTFNLPTFNLPQLLQDHVAWAEQAQACSEKSWPDLESLSSFLFCYVLTELATSQLEIVWSKQLANSTVSKNKQTKRTKRDSWWEICDSLTTQFDYQREIHTKSASFQHEFLL